MLEIFFFLIFVNPSDICIYFDNFYSIYISVKYAFNGGVYIKFSQMNAA